MQYRVRRFGIHSTALTAAIIYFVFALVFVPILYLASRDKPGDSMPTIVYVLGPFLYAAFSYVFIAIACWLYNLVGGWTGGIAFSLEPDGAEAEATRTR